MSVLVQLTFPLIVCGTISASNHLHQPQKPLIMLPFRQGRWSLHTHILSVSWSLSHSLRCMHAADCSIYRETNWQRSVGKKVHLNGFESKNRIDHQMQLHREGISGHRLEDRKRVSMYSCWGREVRVPLGRQGETSWACESNMRSQWEGNFVWMKTRQAAAFCMSCRS